MEPAVAADDPEDERMQSYSWDDPPPEPTALVSDGLVLFPCDRCVLIHRAWQMHPELVDASSLQS
jgi:hypothetical protein